MFKCMMIPRYLRVFRVLRGYLTLTLLTMSACRGQQPRNAEGDPGLTAAVDSLMPRLEQLSGLKKLKPITMKQQSREALRDYVAQRLKEELPPAELNGIRATYAALGLIPDTLNL